MKVLVTGGSGFIGSYVVERLLRDGHKVLVFDHNSHLPDTHPNEAREYETFLGDIRDDISVTEAMAHVDSFIHLAGVLGTQETIQNPKPAILTNVTAGLNVLEAAAQYNIPGVNIAVGNFWENNPYSISKNMVERLVHMYNSYRNTNVAIVRALNAYGPRQSVAAPYGASKVRKIMPSFIAKTLYRHPIEIYGDGGQIMDMIYVSDVADILVDTLYSTALGMRPLKSIEAGTGRDTTVLQIAETVRDTFAEFYPGSVAPPVRFLPLRPGETPGAVVKAQEPLDRQFVPLEEGVRRTFEYYDDTLEL